MASPEGRRILFVIGGGIAAYKALTLIRLLKKAGASVRAVMTPAAHQFVTPLSVASLTGEKVNAELFSLTDEAEMGHIELSRNADIVVVAPATADLLAKMASGRADDLASTLLLATDKVILAAPAMNLRMWLHPATQRNLALLKGDGVRIVGPDDGDMACGEYGPGRMSEPDAILAAIEAALDGETVLPLPPGVGVRGPKPLAGRHVLVTSGPTHEPIDPVRYIANRSSGRQGHAIAAAALAAGARVTLVSGPVSIAAPAGVTVRRVETAREMAAAVAAALPADVFVAAAAVADWRVRDIHDDKIKKTVDGLPELAFVENPDILAGVAHAGPSRPRLVVGFAAETRDLLTHAQAKLARKGCDLIVANDVGAGTQVMGGAQNSVHLISAGGVESWPRMTKEAVADRLVALFAGFLERSAP